MDLFDINLLNGMTPGKKITHGIFRSNRFFVDHYESSLLPCVINMTLNYQNKKRKYLFRTNNECWHLVRFFVHRLINPHSIGHIRIPFKFREVYELKARNIYV
jgi:hypothetical protein